MFVDRNPLGYKNLLTWKQANEIFELTEKFVATLPKKHPKTGQDLASVADHMLRSGRSGIRNIEEGFSRTSTKEYISFLGFSKGSLEELLGDFLYCQKAGIGDQKICERAIYLLKGEGKMLHNQIESLKKKMAEEGGVSVNERFWKERNTRRKIEAEFDAELQKIIDDHKAGKGS